MAKKLFLVDGSNHAFRVFHAMPKMTAAGKNTGALLGFANMLRKLEADHAPDHVVVVFDRGKSFRSDMYPEYKANRSAMPEELAEQWPLFPELVEAWGYRCVSMEGFEADDIIGTLAKRWAGPEMETWLLTGDKDFYQLVDEHIQVLDLMKKREIRAPEVAERFGVDPGRVVDVLGLAGDSSDNVPGVTGIGEKTATKLVTRFGTLEEVILHAGEVGGKRGAALVEEAEMAKLSKDLVTIRTTVPMDLSLEDLSLHTRDSEALRELFVRYQFRSHLRNLDQEGGGSSGVDRSAYGCIWTEAELEAVVAAIREVGEVSVDLETTSLDPQQASLVGVCLCWAEDKAVYVPLGHVSEGKRLEGQLTEEVAMRHLAPLLADEGVGKIGHNLKYDLSVLSVLGYTLGGIISDTMLADYLLEPDRSRHRLDDLALRHLGHNMISFHEAIAGLDSGATFADVSIEKATEYGAEDAHVTWLLHQLLEPRIAESEIGEVYREIELPLIPVLAEMEISGIAVDTERLAALSVELGERIETLEEEIHKLAGRAFTVNSPKQLQGVLFHAPDHPDEDQRGLGLTPLKKTKTGFSTDAETLDRLSGEHPLPAAVLDYRTCAKLKSTYVDALPRAVSEVDGRIHTSFHQAVAATGRLASSNPNLQNIPSRTSDGRRVRACFVPPPGCVLLSCDYSQIELRLLAHYCGEGGLVEAFQQGQDIHRRTASEIFGVDLDAVKVEQRSAAKAINFGIVYGMSAFRLANELKIRQDEARNYMAGYFSRYPQVKVVHEDLIVAAREHGYALTLWGRRRPISDIDARNPRDRGAAERIAINTPLQGTAADLIKIAMLRVSRRLAQEEAPATLLLQVHDELLLEVREDAVEDVARMVCEEMERAAQLKVPIVVDAGWGHNWSEAH